MEEKEKEVEEEVKEGEEEAEEEAEEEGGACPPHFAPPGLRRLSARRRRARPACQRWLLESAWVAWRRRRARAGRALAWATGVLVWTWRGHRSSWYEKSNGSSVVLV